MSEFFLWALAYLIVGLGIAVGRKIYLVKIGRGWTYNEERMLITILAWSLIAPLIFLKYVDKKLEEYFTPDKS